MPAKSAAQQKAAGTALAAKRGETSPSSSRALPRKWLPRKCMTRWASRSLKSSRLPNARESQSTSRHRGRAP